MPTETFCQQNYPPLITHAVIFEYILILAEARETKVIRLKV